MSAPIEPVYQALGARIRMIRETLGLDQATLAERVGRGRPSIANVELGKERILLHQLALFATALGTTPKHLLRGIWT